MIVFCPRCGSKNKNEEVICHNCGQDLPQLKQEKILRRNERKISYLSTSNFILTSAGSLFCSFFAMYLLLNNLVEWSFISTAFLILGIVFIVSAMLSIYSKFYLKQNEFQISENDSDKALSADTKELLPEADVSNIAPASVVEHTTRKLKPELITKKKV